MDANLQRPSQLADRGDWTLDAGAAWDPRARVVRLAGARTPTWQEDTAAGEARVAAAPGSIDRFGTRARVEAVAGGQSQVVATGAASGAVTIVEHVAAAISDAAIGHDDVLYLAIGDRVQLHDLRGRWPDASVATPCWRLAAGAPGGVYVATARPAGSAIVRLVGAPLRPLPFEYAADVFRPRPEDPDPPRIEPVTEVPAGVVAAAIATSPSGKLALIGWAPTGPARLYLLGAAGLGAGRALAGAQRPFSLAWVDDDRVAILVATAGGGTAAAVYAVEGDGAATPVGELYPLREPSGEPFLHGAAIPPHYPCTGDVARPLVPVSWPSFVERCELRAARVVDGQLTGTIWHRIYLEAALPVGTSVRIWLAAGDELVAPRDDAWFEHRFGDARDAPAGVPRGVWVDAPSEMPFHAGLLPCARRPERAGLYTALIQRAGRRVRSLAGRFLWVRVELVGDGRSTPELAALRLYAGRRGYAGLYLPELYREDVFGSDGDAAQPATPADFLDRLLGAFESVLTPLEDRVASAWLLTTPSAVPEEALDWLASWLGFVFAADLPVAARRSMLERAWELYQRRGTRAGLELALDLASGGGVTRREIIVVEDFRLRRTFSTILGADLSDASDPLLPGPPRSGNSLVGDTLILGQDDRASILAVFAPELAIGDARRIAADEAAVAALFDRLAHRATVLVHQEIEPQALGLLRQVIALEAPAHVEVKLVTASDRFRVAVSSLVGIDTFLAVKPAPGPVILDRSQLGVRDLVQRLPSLDPRLGRTS